MIARQIDTSTHGAEEAELEGYVAYWQQRNAEYQVLCQKLLEQARADAAQIAAMLRMNYGARRVILFGSVRNGRFTPESDIDLVVEGLARGDFFAALAQANALAHTWVDLKPMEDLHPRFRERVLATGEDL